VKSNKLKKAANKIYEEFVETGSSREVSFEIFMLCRINNTCNEVHETSQVNVASCVYHKQFSWPLLQQKIYRRTFLNSFNALIMFLSPHPVGAFCVSMLMIADFVSKMKEVCEKLKGGYLLRKRTGILLGK